MSQIRIALACAALIFLGRIASAQTTTLELKVFSPSPPITDTDPIQLDATSTDLIFPDSGHDLFSTFTLNGFNIDWEITSSDDHNQVAVPIVLPLGTQLNLGPLAPGAYIVHANWENVNAILYPGAPSSGSGITSFLVVPEPSAFTLLAL